MTEIFGLIPLAFFSFMLALAGIGDLTTMRISNRLVITLLVGYLIFAPLNGLTLPYMATSLLAAFIVFCLGFGAFIGGWMGGGDVKLMATTALWLGFAHMPAFLIWTSALGGILALVMLLYRSVDLGSVLPASSGWASHLHQPTTRMPYGVAISLAALFVFTSTPWVAALP